MTKSSRLAIFIRCPKTGRVTGVARADQLPLVLLPIAGFLALVWYVFRVVPKPSRAAYPCQQVAAPLAGSFLVWLGATGVAGVALGRARARMRQARYVAAGAALAIALAGTGAAALSQGGAALARPATAYPPHPANTPLGTARGLAPGRVAWAHDPKVTTWDGTSTAAGQRWFDKVSQAEATAMMQWAVMGYAGKATTAEAWDAIFRHFNGGAPYQPGEKIIIKINLTTSNAPNCADANYNWNPSGCGATWTSVGQSPQLMIALLDQLVNVVGAAQADITIGDSTGLWVNELYNPVHNAFPNVRYMDARGTLGRTLSVRSSVPIYWSTTDANGKLQDYILQAQVNAKYAIDTAVLKSHERAGITVTAKNHFGSFSGGNNDTRKPTTANYYNWHPTLPLEPSGAPNRAQMGQYRPLVDMNAHEQMGPKTLLYVVDAIYTGRGWSGAPSKWRVPPFCSDPECGPGDEFWPASLFLSMDQVAMDSVGFDLLSQRTEWTEVLQAEGVQDYLHEMALAANPPSGTFYDPERDGARPPSQGAHEHWNDAGLRQYSRNKGAGAGIDLVYITGDPTKDAAARKTDGPVAVDGAAEALWANAPAQAVQRVIAGSAPSASDLSGSFRALYDDTDLYLLVDVTDERLVKDSTAWYDDDSVAILVDGDYSRGAAYDGANDFELGFRWNDPVIARGANSAPVPTGTAFAMAATGTGYRLEVRLPLDGLGITPGYGGLFGLDVQVNDDDEGNAQRDTKMAWWATTDNSSSDPGAFGACRLEGPERVKVTAAAEGAGVLLAWEHFAWNDAYEAHRSAAPYFAPDAGTQIGEVTPPESAYLDAGPVGTAFYVTRAKEGGAGVASNRVGRFEFGLTTP